MRLEHLEQPVHVLSRLLGVLLKLNLVAAGAQRGAGCVLEFLDRAGLFLVQVDQVFVEDAINTIQTAVDFLDVVQMPACLLDDTGHAGIDHRSRAAGLGHQQVADQVISGAAGRVRGSV